MRADERNQAMFDDPEIKKWRDRVAAAELENENLSADLRIARAELDELRALVVRQALELARRGFP